MKLKTQAGIKPGLMETHSTRRHQASITCLYSLHSLGMKPEHHTIYNEKKWYISQMGKYRYLSGDQSIKVKAGMNQSCRKIKQMLYNMKTITKFNTQVL